MAGADVADCVVVAELALVPARVVADACRRPGGADDALRLLAVQVERFFVELDALEIDLVGVLADAEVRGAVHVRPAHVHVHLVPVLRLGDLDALLL
jgi:hypothetical protein